MNGQGEDQSAMLTAERRRNATPKKPVRRSSSRKTKSAPRRNRPKSTGLLGGLTFSRLTLTIVVANLIGLVILLLGSLGMTQYRDGLIAAKLEGVRGNAQVIADIMAQVAADDTNCDGIDPLEETCRVTLREDAVNLVFSRLWDSFEGRVRVFNAPNDFTNPNIKDANTLLLEDVVLRKDVFDPSPLPDIQEDGVTFDKWWRGVERTIVQFWPAGNFQRNAAGRTLEKELTEAFAVSPLSAQRGVSSVRYNEEGELVASVSVPIRKVQAVYGVVTAEIGGIQDLVDEARTAIFPFFALALIAALLTSLLLTAAIAQPIRQLAIGADKVREGIAVAGRVRIPDFSGRRDEIGELSASLRAMTAAIYARIEAIESFAADVSHELKNPLTSIRSATETLEIAKSPEAQTKLMGVIKKDVARMDRLITDISNASRLDAELARETREYINLEQLLKDIVDLYRATHKEGRAQVTIINQHSWPASNLFGSASALGQVFRNVIDNAISFSPPDGTVRIWMDAERFDNMEGHLLVMIADDGPGIPPENLESIFKRFYTKRPAGTAFGNNSGLGLAISRQIVESHGGKIWASNQVVKDGTTKGALFHIELPLRI